MNHLIRSSVVMALLAVAVSTTACSDSGQRTGSGQATSTVSTTSAGSTVAGDLPARWWQWTESVEPTANPIDDSDGSSCAMNQPPDVWFLAGTHGGRASRSCTLPSGRPVYFPVINTVCEVTADQSETEAADQCRSRADVATATLDHSAMTVTETESNGSFDVVSAPGSTAFGPGRHTLVTWGLWAGPVTLSPGRHQVVLHGRSGTFETQVEYTLTVR